MTGKCGRSARRHIALDCHSRTPTFSTLAYSFAMTGESVHPNAHRHTGPRANIVCVGGSGAGGGGRQTVGGWGAMTTPPA